MMDKEIYNWKAFHAFFKKGESIPISPKASKDAFKEAHERLMKGKIVGLFPEGEISKDGKLGKFHRGYELIETDYDGVIVPYFIEGVFGSVFSKYKPKNGKLFFKRRVITVYYGAPISKNTKADELRDVIEKLKDENEAKSK